MASSSTKYGGVSSPKASSPKSGTSSAGMEGHKPQCVCAPTTHEGSFRCRLHRSSSSKKWDKLPSAAITPATASPTIEAQ